MKNDSERKKFDFVGIFGKLLFNFPDRLAESKDSNIQFAARLFFSFIPFPQSLENL